MLNTVRNFSAVGDEATDDGKFKRQLTTQSATTKEEYYFQHALIASRALMCQAEGFPRYRAAPRSHSSTKLLTSHSRR